MIYNNIEFFEIPGYDKYYISKCGQILSIKRNTKKIMRPSSNGRGYQIISIRNNNGIRKAPKVHRLVCRTFLLDYSEDLHVDHKDNNKTNNNLSNLRMVTVSQNNKNILKKNGIHFDNCKNSFVATWREDKRKSKSFSVNQYGYLFAYLLATDYRKQMVDKFYDRPN